MLITDAPRTLKAPEPELLIEEARELQRRRHRRRAALLWGAVLAGVLGVGIVRFAGVGNWLTGGTAHPLAAGAGSTPAVIFEKLAYEQVIPHRPAVRGTYDTWIASSTPLSWRVRVAGSSLSYGRDPIPNPPLGRELAVDEYDAGSHTIYRVGGYLPPSPPSPTTMAGAYRHLFADPRMYFAGTRIYAGHRVDVVTGTFQEPSGGPGLPRPPRLTWVFYIDAKSYVPVLFMQTQGSARTVLRAVVWKTLPATAANLKLASLARTHAGAPVVRGRLVRVAKDVFRNVPPAHTPHIKGPAPLYAIELSDGTVPTY